MSSFIICCVAIVAIVLLLATVVTLVSNLSVLAAVFSGMSLFFGVAALACIVWRFCVKTPKHRYKFKSIYLGFAGVFLALFCLYVPIVLFDADSQTPLVHSADWGDALGSVFTAVFTTIRNFFGDGDFAEINAFTSYLSGGFTYVRYLYRIYAALLFVIAPIFSVGIALTFFVNASAIVKYALGFKREAYIFSELNERSLALASSFMDNDPNRMLVFTHVIHDNEQRYSDLIDRAEDLGAILFEDTITRVDFAKTHKYNRINFIIIGDNEEDNLSNLVQLTARPDVGKAAGSYGYDFNRYAPKHKADETEEQKKKRLEKEAKKRSQREIKVYIFSNDDNTGKITESIKTEFLKVRKVGDSRSLINRFLYNDGSVLFKNAREIDETFINPKTGKEDKAKLIKVLVLGGGVYGFEMTKALTWFCQMYPYKIEIVVFDKNKNVRSRFKAQCPELMAYNGNSAADQDFTKNLFKDENDNYTYGDAHYNIRFVPNVDVESSDFQKKILKESDATFVWVALGDDDLNMRVATNVRMLFARMRITDGYVDEVIAKKKAELDFLTEKEEKGEITKAEQNKKSTLIKEVKWISEQALDKKINYFLPDVYSVVYNPKKVESYSTSNIFGDDNDDYKKMQMVGSLRSTYTESNVISPEYELSALNRHIMWQKRIIEETEKQLKTEQDPKKIEELNKRLSNSYIADYEKDFWTSSYGFYSSLAAAIHSVYKAKCRQPGYCKGDDAPGYTDEPFEQNMPEERGNCLEFIRMLEHMRWNAYIRAEGYVFHDPKTKSNVAKIHRCLVPFDKLPENEREKDDD